MRKTDLALVLPEYWQHRGWWSWLTRPLSFLYAGGCRLREFAYAGGLKSRRHVDATVIVVGNVTVGGSGKTPLVLALAAQLHQHGHQPGIVCRGYGGTATDWPLEVRADTPAHVAGDEAVMMAMRGLCPVAAGPDRVAAAELLINEYRCDIIVSDDGLQHLGMARDLEIAVVDARRRFGNGLLLPSGPLRESISRLNKVDFIAINLTQGFEANPVRRQLAHLLDEHHPPIIEVKPAATKLVNVFDREQSSPLERFEHQRVHAVAGIGNPQRFFDLLDSLGVAAIPHAFADHHAFLPGDVGFDDNLPVIMTEKDAVKCQAFKDQLEHDRYWFVVIDVKLDNTVVEAICATVDAPVDATAARA